MKKVLLATTAITAISLAGIASAQESQMMSAGGNTLSIGGYYEFGYASASDDLDVNDGSDSKTYGESELFIDFSTTADSGLTYGVQIDLEIVNGSQYGESGTAKNAEESSLFVSGDFGTIHFGHDDNAYGRFQTWAPTHEGATSQDDNILFGAGRLVMPATSGGSSADITTADAAVTAAETAVDTAQAAFDADDDNVALLATLNEAEALLAVQEADRAALDPTAASAYGHSLAYTPAGQGASYEDNAKVTYISPNFSGFSFGASFGDSDSAEDNPTAFGASYSMDIGGMNSGTSLTFTGGSYSNNADGSAKSSDTHYGVTLGMGAMTLTASTYSGEHGDTDKDATEFGIGYQVSDQLSLGAAFNSAESTGDVDQEGDFQSVSGSYSIAPGLKTTLAFNQFDVSDNAELTSNDGTSMVWQLEFGF